MLSGAIQCCWVQCPAVLSLADPAVRSCIPDVSLRLHVKRSHGTSHCVHSESAVPQPEHATITLKVHIVLLMVRK